MTKQGEAEMSNPEQAGKWHENAYGGLTWRHRRDGSIEYARPEVLNALEAALQAARAERDEARREHKEAAAAYLSMQQASEAVHRQQLEAAERERDEGKERLAKQQRDCEKSLRDHLEPMAKRMEAAVSRAETAERKAEDAAKALAVAADLLSRWPEGRESHLFPEARVTPCDGDDCEVCDALRKLRGEG